MERRYDSQEIPSAEYPFFLYDQVDFKFFFFRTEQERDQFFEEDIRPSYMMAGFAPQDLELVMAGVMTHAVGKVRSSYKLKHLADLRDSRHTTQVHP